MSTFDTSIDQAKKTIVLEQEKFQELKEKDIGKYINSVHKSIDALEYAKEADRNQAKKLVEDFIKKLSAEYNKGVKTLQENDTNVTAKTREELVALGGRFGNITTMLEGFNVKRPELNEAVGKVSDVEKLTFEAALLEYTLEVSKNDREDALQQIDQNLKNPTEWEAPSREAMKRVNEWWELAAGFGKTEDKLRLDYGLTDDDVQQIKLMLGLMHASPILELQEVSLVSFCLKNSSMAAELGLQAGLGNLLG